MPCGEPGRLSLGFVPRVNCHTCRARKRFEQQIATLDSLRQADQPEQVQALQKALGNRNNFIVGKAADLVREFKLTAIN